MLDHRSALLERVEEDKTTQNKLKVNIRGVHVFLDRDDNVAHSA